MIFCVIIFFFDNKFSNSILLTILLLKLLNLINYLLFMQIK